MKSLTKRVESRCGELATLTTPELIEKLQSALRVTVDSLLEVAAIVRVLEDRGEDLDHLKLQMIDWFRRIAYGQVLPEVVERYRNKPRLLEEVASLPIPDQDRLSKPTASVALLTFTNDEPSERQVDPIDMTATEIRQAFARGKIRNLAEQRGWINDRNRPRLRSTQELETGVLVDRRKRCLIINGLRLSRSQLLSYLSQFDD